MSHNMPKINEKNNIIMTPTDYAKAAALANAVGEEMLARLEWMALQPSVIVDVGCGVGFCTALLQQRYSAAKIIALDVAHPMLKYSQQQAKKDGGKISLNVCADTMKLPFADGTVDFVFANLILPWLHNVDDVVREWRRVLRPNGLLMFTSLGPDTLQTWRAVLGDFTIPHFIDMHEIGDALTRAKFADPVMDVEFYTLNYSDRQKLFAELQASGMLVSRCYKEIETVDPLTITCGSRGG
jgi:malonyl-CoA O-methyltransferase